MLFFLFLLFFSHYTTLQKIVVWERFLRSKLARSQPNSSTVFRHRLDTLAGTALLVFSFEREGAKSTVHFDSTPATVRSAVQLFNYSIFQTGITTAVAAMGRRRSRRLFRIKISCRYVQPQAITQHKCPLLLWKGSFDLHREELNLFQSEVSRVFFCLLLKNVKVFLFFFFFCHFVHRASHFCL